MAHRTVVIGGGAAGIGAAGGVKAADPRNEVVVYTEFEDVGYSPCGIPYVHGKEIDTFERLFLAPKEAYVQAGIDVHYETRVTSIDMTRKVVDVVGEGDGPVGPPRGGHRVRLRRPGRARRRTSAASTTSRTSGGPWSGTRSWTRSRSAVVVQASPLGLEMTTALAHRGIETHLVDPQPVGAGRDGRSRHHRAGPGVLARRWGPPALQHHAQGLRRRAVELAGVETSDGEITGRPRRRLHAQAAQHRPRRARPA